MFLSCHVLQDPLQLSCGDLFCRLCVEPHLTNDAPLVCPNCDEELDPACPAFPDNSAKKEILTKLKGICVCMFGVSVLASVCGCVRARVCVVQKLDLACPAFPENSAKKRYETGVLVCVLACVCVRMRACVRG